MKRFLLCVVFLYCHVCSVATEYLLAPKLTFVIKSGYFTSDIYQILTGSCAEIEFEKFNIYKKIDENWRFFGEVNKGADWTRSYSFYQQGHLLCKHHAFFNLGSLFDSLKSFEVKDNQGTLIGYVSGTFFTNQAAKFSFYNDKNEQIGLACLDSTWSTLEVFNENLERVYHCKKLFHFNLQTVWSWLLSKKTSDIPDVYQWAITHDTNSKEVDPRFFWPFLCFISEVWWAGQTL